MLKCSKFFATMKKTFEDRTMKDVNKSLLSHGKINIFIHFPVLIATSFWGLWIVGIFNLDSLTEPFWSVVVLLPMLIPPVSCVAGIVRGSVNFKKYNNGPWCLTLSIIGLFIYIAVIFLCSWLGSIA